MPKHCTLQRDFCVINRLLRFRLRSGQLKKSAGALCPQCAKIFNRVFELAAVAGLVLPPSTGHLALPTQG